MKTIRKALCLILFGLQGLSLLQAQNREIKFETGSFRQVLDKAQKEGKMIFMDCYTSWCGPCKMLAKNVFTVDSVADFFNTHFVNFSQDMEKGEGVELKEKYQVEAYPTLLLINAQGEAVYRSVGGCTAGELLSHFRSSMNPENTLSGMRTKFTAGERNPQFVMRYWTALQKAQLLSDLAQSTQMYFKDMPVAAICNDANWPLYERFVDIDNPLHHLMVDHVAEFKQLRGVEFMEKKLAGDYDAAIMNRIPNIGHTAGQLQQYEEDICKIGISDTTALFYLRTYLQIAKMKVEKRYDDYLAFMEHDLDRFSQAQRTRACVSLIMLNDATPQQRQKGNDLLMREAMRIMKDNKGVLPAYEQQLFGFIQYKLQGKQKE